MKKRIVLCADDYGQAFPISIGILDLVSQRRLTAVSCLVNEPEWRTQAAMLSPFHSQVDLGLHFNLTQGEALSRDYQTYYGHRFLSLPSVMLKSLTKRWRLDILEQECHAQLNAFIDAMGFLPHYLDGHQHVHQFPVIREAVMKVFKERLASQHAYFRFAYERTSSSHLGSTLKKWVIRSMSGSHLSRELTKHKIFHNQSFAGSYPFHKARQYRDYFLKFLQEIETNGVIMCHPGQSQIYPRQLDFLQSERGIKSSDAIASARMLEYHYFSSEQFLKDCADHSVELVRFRVC
jgi:hypothetical protein